MPTWLTSLIVVVLVVLVAAAVISLTGKRRTVQRRLRAEELRGEASAHAARLPESERRPTSARQGRAGSGRGRARRGAGGRRRTGSSHRAGELRGQAPRGRPSRPGGRPPGRATTDPTSGTTNGRPRRRPGAAATPPRRTTPPWPGASRTPGLETTATSGRRLKAPHRHDPALTSAKWRDPGMGQVPAATRTLRVLRFLAGQPEPVSLDRIARSCSLPRSTAYHLLTAMIEEGFVVHLADEHRYGLGVAAFEVGTGFSRQEPLQRISRRTLADLVDGTGQTAHLAVLHGRDVLYVVEERAPRRPLWSPTSGFGCRPSSPPAVAPSCPRCRAPRCVRSTRTRRPSSTAMARDPAR